MNLAIPARFDLVRTLKATPHSIAFIGTDHNVGHSQVFVKIVKAGRFNPIRDQRAEGLGWFTGVAHPLLAQVLDAGLTVYGDFYYVRECFDAPEPLSQATPDTIVSLVSAVRFLRQHGRIHGGLKPSNVFLAETIKIADPKIDGVPSLGDPGEHVRFTAPEVLKGSPLTLDSDLYSLGAILYRSVTGQDPFDDPDVHFLRSKYLWASITPVGNVHEKPSQLSGIVHELLNKDPAQRNAAFAELSRLYEHVQHFPSRAPFIGHETELSQIQQTIEKHSVPRLEVIFVEGEPRIGKTRLIHEIRGRLAFKRIIFAAGRCSSTEHRPFQPVLNAIHSLLWQTHQQSDGELQTQAKARWPVVSKYLFDPSAEHRTDEYPTERVVGEIAGFLKSITLRHRTVLVIEDIHHADSGTESFLHQLCCRAAEAPLVVVLTGRPDQRFQKMITPMMDCLNNDFGHLRLGTLTDTEARTLSAFLTNTTSDAGVTMGMSFGNPGWIEESVQSSRDASSRQSAPAAEAVNWMLSSLGKSARLVAQCMSLFSKPLAIEILQKLTELSMPQLEADLIESERVGLVARVGNTVVLRHPAARTKLYSTLSTSRRTELSRRAFELLCSTENDKEMLSELAFQATQYTKAAELYRQLAESSYRRKNYPNAVAYYERSNRYTRLGGPSLSEHDWRNLAAAYNAIGKSQKARRIYDKLLFADDVQADPELQSSIYTSLAGLLEKKTAAARVALYQRAVDCLPLDSPSRIARYSRLCFALLRTGDISAAENVLQQAESICSPNDVNDLRVDRGLLLLSSGDFKAAADYLQSANTPWISNETSLNNLAVCLEHLGDLDNARAAQIRAQELAGRTGYIPIQIRSLQNLGCIEGKRGNTQTAERLLLEAHGRIEALQRQDARFDAGSFISAYLDAALHFIQVGKYSRAHVCLLRAHSGETPFDSDRILAGIVRCEYSLVLCQPHKVGTLLKRFKNSQIFNTDFIRVERALIEAQLPNGPAEQCVGSLKEALALTEKLETLYQKCRVLIQLATATLNGARAEAEAYAREALALAKAKHFRPLAARASLLAGVAAENGEDKRQHLFNALQEATEMGLPELVAETSSEIGTMQLAAGNHLNAREYLIKGISVTTDLAEEIPLKFRMAYLSKPWRRRARQLLVQCNQRLAADSPLAWRHEDDRRDDRYFRSIYRFTIVSSSFSSVETLVDTLVQILDATLGRQCVVSLKGTNGAAFRKFIKLTPSNEIEERLQSVSRQAKNRIYFGPAEAKSGGTVAWIPFSSEQYSGEIYAGCGRGEPQFSEKEMEFLTVLGSVTDGVLKRLEERARKAALSGEVTHFHGIVGASKAIKEVYSQIQIAAGNAATVLIEGESGTGKELVAKAIHKAGARVKQPFIAVDCGAIPETLIEAELFGAKRGSYTGAVVDRAGLFEAAHRGTIFLDEISNTTPALQVKLLRVIQEREVRRIGETKGRPVDVRLIVASNASLDTLSQSGQFRNDLLYRLKVLHIKVPPLRSRRDDIPMLAHAFLERLNIANKTKKHFAPGIINRLSTQNFPGNVRELQNTIERGFFSAKGMAITETPVDDRKEQPPSPDEIAIWFKDISEGRKDFWSAVRNRYKRRDISREKVVALVDLGLRSTRGNYRTMASVFRLKENEYRRFMDFLRRNECLLDFRPYRKAAGGES